MVVFIFISWFQVKVVFLVVNFGGCVVVFVGFKKEEFWFWIDVESREVGVVYFFDDVF